MAVSVERKLLALYDDNVEHVGFVLKRNRVVEVENASPNPSEGFDVKGEDIVRYGPEAVATWHTHPKADNNLSVNDYETFLNWPELRHYIIGKNGLRCYTVKDGEVVIAP